MPLATGSRAKELPHVRYLHMQLRNPPEELLPAI
jgi:hypothetical protein